MSCIPLWPCTSNSSFYNKPRPLFLPLLLILKPFGKFTFLFTLSNSWLDNFASLRKTNSGSCCFNWRHSSGIAKWFLSPWQFQTNIFIAFNEVGYPTLPLPNFDPYFLSLLFYEISNCWDLNQPPYHPLQKFTAARIS